MKLPATLPTAFTRATASSKSRIQLDAPARAPAKPGFPNHDGSHYALYDGYPKRPKRSV